jgi:hypothetical protein
MKLPIKKKYFDEILSGKKKYEYRDAHITFVCEETGQTLRMNIFKASIVPYASVPIRYRKVLTPRETQLRMVLR